MTISHKTIQNCRHRAPLLLIIQPLRLALHHSARQFEIRQFPQNQLSRRHATEQIMPIIRPELDDHALPGRDEHRVGLKRIVG